MRARRAGVALSFVVALIACGGRKGTEPVAITDDEVARYVQWVREWGELTKRHVAENDAAAKRAETRYAPFDGNAMSRDPEFLAVLDRHRDEMQQHMNSMPLAGPQLEAFKAVMAGIIPRHDEQVLLKAREKYGDKFVDLVLKHEHELSTITFR